MLSAGGSGADTASRSAVQCRAGQDRGRAGLGWGNGKTKQKRSRDKIDDFPPWVGDGSRPAMSDAAVHGWSYRFAIAQLLHRLHYGARTYEEADHGKAWPDRASVRLGRAAVIGQMEAAVGANNIRAHSKSVMVTGGAARRGGKARRLGWRARSITSPAEKPAGRPGVGFSRRLRADGLVVAVRVVAVDGPQERRVARRHA